MGMFDYIKVEIETPPLGSGIMFQTKSLHRQLFEYTITKDKRLILSKKFDGPQDKFVECSEDVKYSGILKFYEYRSDMDPNWYEYDATFENGVMVKIERAK